MSKNITVKIIRPELENLDPDSKKELINQISKDIAQQIIASEEKRLHLEHIAYWQQKLLNWELEDTLYEINYGHLRTSTQKS